MNRGLWIEQVRRKLLMSLDIINGTSTIYRDPNLYHMQRLGAKPIVECLPPAPLMSLAFWLSHFESQRPFVGLLCPQTFFRPVFKISNQQLMQFIVRYDDGTWDGLRMAYLTDVPKSTSYDLKKISSLCLDLKPRFARASFRKSNKSHIWQCYITRKQQKIQIKLCSDPLQLF